MSTKRMLSVLLLLGVLAAFGGSRLLRILPGRENEVRLATLIVVATLMLGATGMVSIWRSEFPLVVMVRGKAAKLLGVVDVLIWAAITLYLLIRLFHPG